MSVVQFSTEQFRSLHSQLGGPPVTLTTQLIHRDVLHSRHYCPAFLSPSSGVRFAWCKGHYLGKFPQNDFSVVKSIGPGKVAFFKGLLLQRSGVPEVFLLSVY